MDTTILRDIGLSENEIKIYISLLEHGTLTAYELSQKTSIYRVHVYDKLEQLMDKGLATHIYKGAKKCFLATPPERLQEFLAEKQQRLEIQQKKVGMLLPDLTKLTQSSSDSTRVEVFKGAEGLKHFLKDIVKTKQEVLISGIDDARYQEALPVYMKQHFRDLRLHKIKERVITVKRKGVFEFDKKTAPTTTYRYLREEQFNPTNTLIYANKVIIVHWGSPVTAIMIENKDIATTYRNHFEHLWRIASVKS